MYTYNAKVDLSVAASSLDMYAVSNSKVFPLFHIRQTQVALRHEQTHF